MMIGLTGSRGAVIFIEGLPYLESTIAGDQIPDLLSRVFVAIP